MKNKCSKQSICLSLILLFLFFLMSCEVFTDSTEDSKVLSVSRPYTEATHDNIAPLTTTIPAETKHSAIDLTLFDINNPEGWQHTIDWDYFLKNEQIITIKDYVLGGFQLGMTFENAVQYFPDGLYTITEEGDEFAFHKILEFESLILNFVKIDVDNIPFGIYSISTSNPEYSTVRGLRVGDNAEKIFALYGTPWYVRNNVWSYICSEAGHIGRKFTVINGVVTEILIQGTM